MGQDFGDLLSGMLGQLNGEEHSKRAVASAAVAMLLAQAPEDTKLPPTAVQAIVPLLQDQNPLIQRNACAALIAVADIQADQLKSELQEWTQAVSHNTCSSSNLHASYTAQTASAALQLQTASQHLAGPEPDVSLRISCAEVLAAVGQANLKAAQAVFDQNGVKAILGVLSQEADPVLQEACTDAICKLATAPENRQMLVQQGALPALTKALHSTKAETHVRVLLALGMLVGNNQDLQAQLADIDGALPRLLELRLQQDDEHSQHIADGIVAAMLKNPQCKQQLTQAFRAPTKAESNNYV